MIAHHILLTEASFVLLIAHLRYCSFDATATLLAKWEIEMAIETLVAHATFNIWPTRTCAVINVALQFIVLNTQRITIAQFTSKVMVESIRVRFAFVALFACHMWWANTRAGITFAQAAGWAIAWFTIWEAIITSTACVAGASNNI